jgi:hypothetical protein
LLGRYRWGWEHGFEVSTPDGLQISFSPDEGFDGCWQAKASEIGLEQASRIRNDAAFDLVAGWIHGVVVGLKFRRKSQTE